MNIHEIEQLTKLLRTNNDYFWEVLRSVLIDRGLDPANTWLVLSSDEGENETSLCEFGVIVTKDKQVYQYQLSVNKETRELSNVDEWQNISETFTSSPYEKEVESAFNAINKSISA